MISFLCSNLKLSKLYKKEKNSAYYKRIYIKKDLFENFKHLLVPHIHESMLYKIKWKI